MYSVSWKCCNAKQTLCSPQPSATCSLCWHNRSNQIFAVVEHETGKLQLANLLVGGNSQSGEIHGIILLSVPRVSVFFGACKCEELKKVQLSLDDVLIYSLTSCLLLKSFSSSLVWGESESFGFFLLYHVIYWEWEPSTLFTAFCVAMAMVGEAHAFSLVKCNFNWFNKCTLKIYSED